VTGSTGRLADGPAGGRARSGTERSYVGDGLTEVRSRAGRQSRRQLKRNDVLLLAQVRRSLRSLNGAIVRGAALAGLTVQQQAFLLATAAHGKSRVPLADVRAELGMDPATASILLAKLVKDGLVVRAAAQDRRSSELSLTRRGEASFRRSLEGIRREIRALDARAELDSLDGGLTSYLQLYLRPGVARTAGVVTPSGGKRRGGR
jgi:DNA-binding MarR family transcriptional regulator